MPRELELRDLVPPLRERAELRGDFVVLLRGDFTAALVLFAPVALRAVEERLAPELDVFARVDGFLAAVERLAFDALPVERLAVEREPADLLALVREPGEDPELPPLLADPSIDHLPDITRCAASATASAISDPSLVALETMLLAACDAVSAASSPASRIFLRAAGLAAIAAAAAVSPAAIISLLIAALASLSTVLSLEREPDEDALEREPEEPAFEELEREEPVREDLAIAFLPASRNRHFRAVPVP